MQQNHLVWALAGGGLFVLLVWQGLRMTYAWWGSPRHPPDFGSWYPGS